MKWAAIYCQDGFISERHAMLGRSMAHTVDVAGRKACTAHRLVRCPRCTLDFAHFNAAVAAVASAGAVYCVTGRSESIVSANTPQCFDCGAVTGFSKLPRQCSLCRHSCWLCLKWCVCCGRLYASPLGCASVCRQCLLVLVCKRIRGAH